MPRARVNGIELFYQELGPAGAEALILIMGWGGDHTVWAFQLSAFSAAFRVVAPDNRGAGQSDAPDTPLSIADMACETFGVMDALGVARAHVAGASMGGMIAQEMALARPDRMLTLQLHCTLARPDAYGRFLGETFLQVKARGDREEFARTTLPWLLSRETLRARPDFVELFLQRAVQHPYPTGYVGLKRQAEAIWAHDTLDRLHEIRVPTLITVGAEDILVPPTFSRELHARIRGSELVVVPDAGHLHFVEQAERFNEVCLGFLHTHRGR